MSSYYDTFGGSSGPPDPFEDEAEQGACVPTDRLVGTFIRPGLAEHDRRSDEAREEDSRIWTCNECGAEGTESELEHHHCEEPPEPSEEPNYNGSELDDHTISTSAPRGFRQHIAIDGALRCADCSALIDPKRDRHTCTARNKRQERLERKARREDGPEYDFRRRMRK